MRGDLAEIHAREKAGMPENWEAYQWRAMPHGGPEMMYMEIKGAVVPAITRGRNIGKPNWKKKHTLATVNISIEEHEKWLIQWRLKTGKCSNCAGAGRVLKSLSIKEGIYFRVCSSCNGTGSIMPNAPKLDLVLHEPIKNAQGELDLE